MDNMLPMLYETIFGFFALFLLTKVLGKRSIAQLNAFDFIAAVVIGELVGNALFDKESGILEIGYVIILWGSLLFIVEKVAQKFKGSRYILEGKPAIIIQKGLMNYDEMRKNKLVIDEVLQLLRTKEIFAVQEVEYAILETNGEISILKKSPYQTPNKHDLNVALTEPQLAVRVISDGEMIEDNVDEAGLTEDWILGEIQKQNFTSLKDVFYAEWTEGQTLYILPYSHIKTKHMQTKYK